jgi:hypothetical protein
MMRKIVISTAVAFLISGALLGPPDAVSQIMLGIEGALLCAIPLVILGRRDFVRSSSSQIQTLVCVLVCTISVLTVTCHMGWRRIGDLHEQATMRETQESEVVQAGE